MARMGNNKKRPTHGRYNANNSRHENKLRRAQKLLKKLEKYSPGKHKIVGHQVVKVDTEFITRDKKDKLGYTTTHIICAKENEERMKQKIRDARRRKLDRKRRKRGGRDPWGYSNTKKARH